MKLIEQNNVMVIDNEPIMLFFFCDALVLLIPYALMILYYIKGLSSILRQFGIAKNKVKIQITLLQSPTLCTLKQCLQTLSLSILHKLRKVFFHVSLICG